VRDPQTRFAPSMYYSAQALSGRCGAIQQNAEQAGRGIGKAPTSSPGYIGSVSAPVADLPLALMTPTRIQSRQNVLVANL
jgi:hypothetical protein